MDYEKAYKEALERARDLHDNHPLGQPQTWMTCEKIFPVLKESEDERIRKEIIQSIQDNMCVIHKDKCLAWLEKQDIKLQEYINEERNKKDFYCEGKDMSWNEMPLDVKKHDYPYYFKDDLDCYPFNVEKQDEQKPIEQDTEIHDLWEYIREWNEKFGRLPKDEDELAACIDYVMKRQKPAWSEEDKTILLSVKCVIDNVWHNSGLSDYDEKELQEMWEWLDEIWRRVAYPQPKQEWSEKDEKFLVDTMNFLYRAKNQYAQTARLEECIDWLKSLKPQKHWKPSEKQMSMLLAVLNDSNNITSESVYIALKSLYNDLKKL